MSPFFLAPLLLLARVHGMPQPEDGECCTEKMVGGVRYTLLGTDDSGMFMELSCLSNCVFEKDGLPGSKFCFGRGDMSVECQGDMVVTPPAVPEGETGGPGELTEGPGGDSPPPPPVTEVPGLTSRQSRVAEFGFEELAAAVHGDCEMSMKSVTDFSVNQVATNNFSLSLEGVNNVTGQVDLTSFDFLMSLELDTRNCSVLGDLMPSSCTVAVSERDTVLQVLWSNVSCDGTNLELMASQLFQAMGGATHVLPAMANVTGLLSAVAQEEHIFQFFQSVPHLFQAIRNITNTFQEQGHATNLLQAADNVTHLFLNMANVSQIDGLNMDQVFANLTTVFQDFGNATNMFHAVEIAADLFLSEENIANTFESLVNFNTSEIWIIAGAISNTMEEALGGGGGNILEGIGNIFNISISSIIG